MKFDGTNFKEVMLEHDATRNPLIYDISDPNVRGDKFADFSWSTLSDQTIAGENFSRANFTGTSFDNVTFMHCTFSHVVLNKGRIIGCEFHNCRFTHCVICDEEFSLTVFRKCKFEVFRIVDVLVTTECLFEDSICSTGDITIQGIHECTGATLEGFNDLMRFVPYVFPTSGSFTGWKKVIGVPKNSEISPNALHTDSWEKASNADRYIVKLIIPEDAKRTSSFGRKCRADKAMVAEIQTIDGRVLSKEEADEMYFCSSFNPHYRYILGQTVFPSGYVGTRTIECAAGIHFFVNREEAVKYLV